ncbi:unnamed protein product [Gordionus sp. m RMFG-2023]
MDENFTENENLLATERLGNKVSKLKSIAVDIEAETKDHVNLLSGMTFDFENTRGFMQNTSSYIKRIINQRKGSPKTICYIVLLLSASFFILHIIFSFKK